MVVAPVAVLMIWAHFVRPSVNGLDLLVMATAAVVGLIGIATSRWRTEVRVAAGLAYVAAAVLVLPVAGLFAVCSTGDCL